jgi:hypothetical protein
VHRERSWRLVEHELTEVVFEGKGDWLLPPHDPYLAQ